MDRDEAMKLLRGGTDGVEKWNARRAPEAAIPDLSHVDLSYANLCKADLHKVNFGSADLSRTKLSGANLSKIKLRKAALSRADLSRANLRNADLKEADLSLAYLNHANLFNANLSDVNFRGANLSDADLSHTKLHEADLHGSKVNNTKFLFVDLSGVNGLDGVLHFGPCAVDVHTLYMSDGKISDIFLRGCGIPEDFIAYKSSFVGSALDFYSCFISYNHEDKQFARRLHDTLQGRGIRCWLDEHELIPGDDIYRGVDEGIRVWDKVLLCCSKDAFDSWWVGREVETAIEREREFHKEHGEQVLKIIPLNLDGSLFDWKDPHAATLRKRLAADFADWKSDADKFDTQLEKVIQALRTDGGRQPAPLPKLGM